MASKSNRNAKFNAIGSQMSREYNPLADRFFGKKNKNEENKNNSKFKNKVENKRANHRRKH
jgi:hypothetical protein